jgi:hypothetical protein
VDFEERNRLSFAINLPLRFDLISQRRERIHGSATVLEISSKAFTFRSSQQLQIGARIRCSISWPVLLNDECPLKLVLEGRLVRSDADRFTANILRYRFQTAGRERKATLEGARTASAGS